MSNPYRDEDDEWVRTTSDIICKFFAELEHGYYKNLRFLFLTKRPDNIPSFAIWNETWEHPKELVWYGTSISDQATADKYIPLLQATNVPNRFLSMEPLAGEVDLKLDLLEGILIQVNGYKTIKFDDLELVTCRPEFTSFNLAVRSKLDELEVDYRADW